MMNTESNTDHTADQSTMIFGTRAIMEALDAGKELEKIFIQRDLNNPLIKELKSMLVSKGLHFQSVPGDKLNRLTRKNHQGVVAYLSMVSYFRIEDLIPELFESNRYPVLFLLDRITDTRNMGAICRSAECFGVDAVIIPERGGALVNGDTVKASAGAINRIRICREPNLKTVIDYLHDSGFKVVGCSEKSSGTLYDYVFDSPVCIIMGSESDGISPEYMKRCDGLVKIPMDGKTASLNVSVASGIVMYEISRQFANSK
jgi:23S rRNA (guanosine2251-2'-O)-methyltransferase